MNANMNSFGISQDIARNTLKISEKDLTRAITDLYLTAYGDYLQWQYNSEVMNLYREEDTVLQALTRSNIYKQNDYMVFLTELHKQHLNTANALLQYKTDLMNLRYESGVKDTSVVYLKDPALQLTSFPQKNQSVFFRQFTLDSLRLINETELIHASYQPHLQFHADAGYLSSLVVTPYKNFGAGIGVSLVIPIYDGKGQQLKIDKVRVQRDNLFSQQSFFENQYDLQTRQIRSLMNDLQKQNDNITGQLGFYNRLIEADKKLISDGQLDILQYFVFIQNYLDLKNQQTLNRIKISMLINQLNYLAN
jgi:outer membrane protein TolC